MSAQINTNTDNDDKTKKDVKTADEQTILSGSANTISPSITIEKLSILAKSLIAETVKDFIIVPGSEKAVGSPIEVRYKNIIKKYSDFSSETVKFLNSFVPLVIAGGEKLSASDLNGKVTEDKQKANDQTVTSILQRFTYFNILNKNNYIFKNFQPRVNFCGLMAFSLYCKFIKNPAFRAGKIKLSYIDLLREDIDSGHSVVLLNGSLDDPDAELNDNTILCNPFTLEISQQIFVGAKEILRYLSGDTTGEFDKKYLRLGGKVMLQAFKAHGKTKCHILNSTDVINFSNLLFERSKLTALVQEVQQNFFQSLITGKPDDFTKYLEETFLKLYSEAQKSGKLDSLAKSGAEQAFLYCNNLYKEVQSKRAKLTAAATADSATTASTATTAMTATTHTSPKSQNTAVATQTTTTLSQYLIKDLTKVKSELILSKGGQILDTSANGTHFTLPAFALKQAKSGGIRESLGLVRVGLVALSENNKTKLIKQIPGITFEPDPEKSNRQIVTFDETFNGTFETIINNKGVNNKGANQLK